MHRGQLLGIQVRKRTEQQPALSGLVVVEVGEPGIAVVVEADDPAPPIAVRRQRLMSPSDSRPRLSSTSANSRSSA